MKRIHFLLSGLSFLLFSLAFGALAQDMQREAGEQQLKVRDVQLQDGAVLRFFETATGRCQKMQVWRENQAVFSRVLEGDLDDLDLPSTPACELIPNLDKSAAYPVMVWVHHYSGGAHCCSTEEFLALDGQPRLLAQLETGHTGLDKESIKPDDLRINDWSFADWNVSFAESSAPAVHLKLRGSEFFVNPEKMRRPAKDFLQFAQCDDKGCQPDHLSPSPEAVAAQFAAACDTGADTLSEHPLWCAPPQLWAAMLDRLYAGHARLALEYFDRAWPKDRPGEEEFMKDFVRQLWKSRWFAEIWQMNGRPQEFASPYDRNTKLKNLTSP